MVVVMMIMVGGFGGVRLVDMMRFIKVKICYFFFTHTHKHFNNKNSLREVMWALRYYYGRPYLYFSVFVGKSRFM